MAPIADLARCIHLCDADNLHQFVQIEIVLIINCTPSISRSPEISAVHRRHPIKGVDDFYQRRVKNAIFLNPFVTHQNWMRSNARIEIVRNKLFPLRSGSPTKIIAVDCHCPIKDDDVNFHMHTNSQLTVNYP